MGDRSIALTACRAFPEAKAGEVGHLIAVKRERVTVAAADFALFHIGPTCSIDGQHGGMGRGRDKG